MNKSIVRHLYLAMAAVLIMTALGTALPILPVRAAMTIIVNTNADNMDNDGFCALREAIVAANTNAPVNGADDCNHDGSTGADTINFAENYTITLADEQLPAVSSQIIVSGNGAANTIIQAHVNPKTAYYRVFEVSETGNLTLDGVTVRNGNCDMGCNWSNTGGGIYNQRGTLTIRNSSVSGNSAEYGGGIYSSGIGGTLTIANSTISDNSASWVGGGIYIQGGNLTINNSTVSDNTSSYIGGGIVNDDILTVANSTFSGNSAKSSGGIFNTGTLTVTNSTFSGNSAEYSGGGIINDGTLTIRNSTLSGNSATTHGGGIYNYFDGTDGLTTLKNTILANPSGGDCYNDGGTLSADRYNFDTDGTCDNATQKTSAQINLGPLADNGGPTQTRALLSGSHAIDAGNDAICAASPVNNLDQRGVTRPQGAHCDVGAFEAEYTPTTITMRFRSNGAKDGMVRESTETSGIGNYTNSVNQMIAVGDDSLKRQYVGILDFDTSSLPNNAFITSAKLQVKVMVISSGVYAKLGNLTADVTNPYFGTSPGLQNMDFGTSALANAGIFTKATTFDQWITLKMKAGSLSAVNRLGRTQFRLRFTLDDSNDTIKHQIGFLSGNYRVVTDRPTLIVTYYIP